MRRFGSAQAAVLPAEQMQHSSQCPMVESGPLGHEVALAEEGSRIAKAARADGRVGLVKKALEGAQVTACSIHLTDDAGCGVGGQITNLCESVIKAVIMSVT